MENIEAPLPGKIVDIKVLVWNTGIRIISFVKIQRVPSLSLFPKNVSQDVVIFCSYLQG